MAAFDVISHVLFLWILVFVDVVGLDNKPFCCGKFHSFESVAVQTESDLRVRNFSFTLSLMDQATNEAR